MITKEKRGSQTSKKNYWPVIIGVLFIISAIVVPVFDLHLKNSIELDEDQKIQTIKRLQAKAKVEALSAEELKQLKKLCSEGYTAACSLWYEQTQVQIAISLSHQKEGASLSEEEIDLLLECARDSIIAAQDLIERIKRKISWKTTESKPLEDWENAFLVKYNEAIGRVWYSPEALEFLKSVEKKIQEKGVNEVTEEEKAELGRLSDANLLYARRILKQVIGIESDEDFLARCETMIALKIRLQKDDKDRLQEIKIKSELKQQERIFRLFEEDLKLFLKTRRAEEVSPDEEFLNRMEGNIGTRVNDNADFGDADYQRLRKLKNDGNKRAEGILDRSYSAWLQKNYPLAVAAPKKEESEKDFLARMKEDFLNGKYSPEDLERVKKLAREDYPQAKRWLRLMPRK